MIYRGEITLMSDAVDPEARLLDYLVNILTGPDIDAAQRRRALAHLNDRFAPLDPS